jgi:hypothetical protein
LPGNSKKSAGHACQTATEFMRDGIGVDKHNANVTAAPVLLNNFFIVTLLMMSKIRTAPSTAGP